MSFAKYLPFLLLAGCAAKHDAPAEKPQPIPVTTVPAAIQTVPSERTIPGTVAARTTAPVSARIPGHIREIRVREGDLVQPGQIIAILDDRDAGAAAKLAEAARDEARAALPESQAAIAQASSQLELARITFRRMNELHESKSITGQEFDEARARLRLAESQLQMAQARQHQTRERIRQAEEALSRTQLQQSYASIAAPFAGLVLERKAEPGTFASPGMPIVILEKTGDFRLEVPVEESLLATLKPGRTVTVDLDGPVDLPISEILPSLNPQSRTATVRINLPARSNLRTGTSASIRVKGEAREAVTIPSSAIRTNGQLQTVFTAANGRARAVLVSTGESLDGTTVIQSGLAPNDRVIVNPPAALADGAPIEVRQ